MFRNFSISNIAIKAILLDKEEINTKNIQPKYERIKKCWSD